jgi:hypothetical protein
MGKYDEPGRSAQASDVLMAELRSNQERFRLATEALVGFLYDYDLTTGLVERFGGLEELVGFKPTEILPLPSGGSSGFVRTTLAASWLMPREPSRVTR